MELNERNIQTAQPGAVLRDAAIPGLHMRVTASRKAFYFYYRTWAKVERRPKLGDYPMLSIADARRAAQKLFAQVAAGNDPSADAARGMSAPTMQQLWETWYKDLGSKQKSAAESERMWMTYLASKLARKFVATVSFNDVNTIHQGLVDKPYQANRVHSLLSALFTYAHRPLRWINDNPAVGVVRYPERKRRRYMTAAEAARVQELLAQLAPAHPKEVAFIQLLTLTGARKSEWENARWDQLQERTLVLDRHKTDSKGDLRTIHLSDAAIAALAPLSIEGEYIFKGLDPSRLWRVIRAKAGCPDLRLHDLRHTFASVALGEGLGLHEIGQLLGHRSTATTERYAHLMTENAQKAAQDISQAILRRRQPL